MIGVSARTRSTIIAAAGRDGHVAGVAVGSGPPERAAVRTGATRYGPADRKPRSEPVCLAR